MWVECAARIAERRRTGFPPPHPHVRPGGSVRRLPLALSLPAVQDPPQRTHYPLQTATTLAPDPPSITYLPGGVRLTRGTLGGQGGVGSLDWQGSWELPTGAGRLTDLCALDLGQGETCIVAASSAGDVVGLRVRCEGGEVQVLQGADQEALLAQQVAQRGAARESLAACLNSVSASPRSAEVACAGDDGRVLVLPDPFDGASAQVLHDTHGAVSYSAACWASEEVVAAAGCDGRIALLDRRAGGPGVCFSFSAGRGPGEGAGGGLVRRLRAAPGGGALAAAHSSGLATLWDLRAFHRPAAVCAPAKGSEPWGDVWDVRFTGGGGTAGWHLVFGTQSGLLGSFSEAAPACKSLFQDSAAINSLDVQSGAARGGESRLVGATDAECLLYMC